MTVRLDALAQAVQRNSDAEDSASQLLTQLADEVRSLEPTQQAIDQFASDLSAKADALAAAVVANTPVESPPTTGTPAEPTGGATPPEPTPSPSTGGDTGVGGEGGTVTPSDQGTTPPTG